MRFIKSNKFLPSVFFLLFLSTPVINLNASTVRSVDLDQMLEESELVFSGEVISSEARRAGRYSKIYTFITFQIDEIIKGDYLSDTITLRFSGGTVDDVTTKVSGLIMPELGEQGIYFVEGYNRRLINPLFGWSQGHVLVMNDEDGEERVYTRNRKPIKDTNEDKVTNTEPFSNGIARGFVVGSQSDEAGMRKQDFIRGLRTRMRE